MYLKINRLKLNHKTVNYDTYLIIPQNVLNELIYLYVALQQNQSKIMYINLL